MSAIDDLIGRLNSGVLVVDSTHDEVRLNPVRIESTGYEDVLMGSDEDVVIMTRNLRAAFTVEQDAPYTSRIDEMPVNHNPDHPSLIAYGWDFWPIRGEGDCPAGVTGLTIHHTMSHSPLSLAQWITRNQSAGGKGYPTTQYHYWVSAGDGCPVWQLVPDEWAVWHDHTGAYQTTLSIGLAGRLHEAPPPAEQLEAAARLVAWLQERYNIPLDEVRGHNDRYNKTSCPGWHVTDWRDEFYGALADVT